MQRLREVDQSALIAESTALLKEAQAKKLFEIPPEAWPPIVKKLAPVSVHNYNGTSLCIILRKWASKESGFRIYPEDYHSRDESQIGTQRQITPQLYWYAL